MIIEAEFSPGMTLAECEEVARLAEEAGFDRLGVSDVVLWPDTFVVQALCARATSRVQIGAMVTNPYSRHPAVTAAAVAALDELSGGRAFLGLGVGAGLEEVGIGYPAPVTTLCRRGWASRSASCGATVPARRPALITCATWRPTSAGTPWNPSVSAAAAGWLECTRPAVTAYRSGSPTPPRLGGTWQQADATIAAAMAETGEDVLVIGGPRAGNVPMYEREGRKHVLRRMLAEVAEVAEVAEAIGWVLNAGWKVRPLSSKPSLFARKRR